ncbi:MAG TPA: FKBP-type peptidyl-prolyl cis-trans isomerase [Kofleriaceae bacterium]|jgi:peptidylprolyl isomerase
MRGVLIACLLLGACHKSEPSNNDQGVEARTGSDKAPQTRARSEQIAPPFDLKTPPPDAVKTPSGLVYKVVTPNATGAQPKRNDTVMVNYTAWKPDTGDTFYTNKQAGKPMPIDLADAAPAFVEALPLLHKGETAMLWVPPNIGFKTKPAKPEARVYEIEIVDIKAAPAVPADLAAPPATATATKSGAKVEVVKPGTGKDKAHRFDIVSYTYSAWDTTGRMFDTTEMQRKPAMRSPPMKLPQAWEDVLTDMVQGERVRFWIDAAKLHGEKEKAPPGLPEGQLCYEVEVTNIEKGVEPPPTPPDVAKPPGDAKKTAKGVFYKVLKTGKGGPKPQADSTVMVNYTGWTTDGKMFDSSTTSNKPAELSLSHVIDGWKDGIPLMSVGDKYRFWIPVDLAYKNRPGSPAGMLVFDVELVEIKPPRPPGEGGPHGPGGPGGPHGMHQMPMPHPE